MRIVPSSLTVAEYMELLQIDLLQPRPFFQYPPCSIVDMLFFPDKPAGQRIAVRRFELEYQYFQLPVVKAKYDAIYRYAGHVQMPAVEEVD